MFTREMKGVKGVSVKDPFFQSRNIKTSLYCYTLSYVERCHWYCRPYKITGMKPSDLVTRVKDGQRFGKKRGLKQYRW